VAICDDMTINRIYGEADIPASKFFKFIELDGVVLVESGTVLNLSRPIEGLSGTIEPLDLETVEEILISFRQGSEDGFAAGFGGRGGLEISDDAWLQTDGSQTDEPCD
jgi:hypothetical protein